MHTAMLRRCSFNQACRFKYCDRHRLFCQPTVLFPCQRVRSKLAQPLAAAQNALAPDDQFEWQRQDYGVVEEEEAEYLEYQEMPVLNPEKGELHRRVGKELLDEVGKEGINPEETAYWFHTPEGGWNPSEKIRKAKSAPVTFPEPQLEGLFEGKERVKLEDLQEGQELFGLCTDVWLYHGAQIDFGADFAGLIPIMEHEWPDVQDDLYPGGLVPVRIHTLRDPNYYRWPVQLEILDPEMASMIISPSEWQSPLHLGRMFDQGMTIEDICEETGRTYTTAKYYPDEDMSEEARRKQWEYGFDDPDMNAYKEDWITREVLRDSITMTDIAQLAGQEFDATEPS